ncbi:ketol-acid reductoisomerase [Vampirovibrio sp.]|uniref:ketol-acid reductoisomerase n=1 Tax=Vampirovibrio sp. TaxID=2717857 RepID=UPI003593FCF0
MPKPILRDSDIDLQPILSRKVVVIGYGNQGKPHALNLRDSGVAVRIGVRPESRKREDALADGFEVLPFAEALAWADLIMLAMPDEVMADVYKKSLAPQLRAGQAIGFVHGLVIHEGWVLPKPDLDVLMVAPKAQGRGVRNKYLAGSGVPGLYAVHQNATGHAETIALAYAKAIGCGRVGVMPTTFAEEAICDLFSEQAVLCGGLTSLIKAAFDTLVERGFSAEVAYFECLYEVKLIADLLHEQGITGMRNGISSTALYGDISQGERVIDGHVRETMRQVLDEIISGKFSEAMRQEFAHGKPHIRQAVSRDEQHLIEQTHRDLRQRLTF